MLVGVKAVCLQPLRQTLDTVSAAAQSNLPQSGELFHRNLCFGALAVPEPVYQFLGFDIDHFNLVRVVKHRIRNTVPCCNAGDGGNRIMQALNIAYVYCGINIYSGFQQFRDVLVTLPMTAVPAIRMRQLINQNQSGFP